MRFPKSSRTGLLRTVQETHSESFPELGIHKMYRRVRNAIPLFTALEVWACGNGGGPVDVNTPPICEITASPLSGYAPLTAQIDLMCTDSDGQVTQYELDLDGDGTYETPQANAEHTYTATTTVRGRGTDNNGARSPVATANVSITPSLVTIDPSQLNFDFSEDGELRYTTNQIEAMINDPGNQVNNIELVLETGNDVIDFGVEGGDYVVTGKANQFGSFALRLNPKDSLNNIVASALLQGSVRPYTDLPQIHWEELITGNPIDVEIAYYGQDENGLHFVAVDNGQFSSNYSAYVLVAQETGTDSADSGPRTVYLSPPTEGQDIDPLPYNISVVTEGLLGSYGLTLSELRQFANETLPWNELQRISPDSKVFVKDEGSGNVGSFTSQQQQFWKTASEDLTTQLYETPLEVIVVNASDSPNINDRDIIIFPDSTIVVDGIPRRAGTNVTYSSIDCYSRNLSIGIDPRQSTDNPIMLYILFHEWGHLTNSGHTDLSDGKSNLASREIPSFVSPTMLIENRLRIHPSVPQCTPYTDLF